MRYRTFLDFMTEGGKNVIQRWLAGLPPADRAAIQQTIIALEAERIPSSRDMKPLRDADGVLEVRVKCGKRAYRVLGCQGPGSSRVTLLVGVLKEGFSDAWKSSLETAKQRRRTVLTGQGRTCEHQLD